MPRWATKSPSAGLQRERWRCLATLAHGARRQRPHYLSRSPRRAATGNPTAIARLGCIRPYRAGLHCPPSANYCNREGSRTTALCAKNPIDPDPPRFRHCPVWPYGLHQLGQEHGCTDAPACPLSACPRFTRCSATRSGPSLAAHKPRACRAGRSRTGATGANRSQA